MYLVCLVWIFHNTQMEVRRLLLGVHFHFPLLVVRIVSKLLYLLAILLASRFSLFCRTYWLSSVCSIAPMNIVEHRFLLVQFFIFWFMLDLKICKSYDFIHCIGLKLQFLLLIISSPKSSYRGGCFGAPI